MRIFLTKYKKVKGEMLLPVGIKLYSAQPSNPACPQAVILKRTY